MISSILGFLFFFATHCKEYSTKQLEFSKVGKHYIYEIAITSPQKKNNFAMYVELDSERSWIKANQCSVCETATDCLQEHSCFISQEQIGIKCDKKYCKNNKQNNFIPTSQVIDGKQMILSIESSKKEQIKMPIVLATKMDKKYEQVGKLSLLQSKGMFKDCNLLLYMDNSQKLKLIYAHRQQQASKAHKYISQQESEDSQQQEEEQIEKQLTQQNNQQELKQESNTLLKGLKTVGEPLIVPIQAQLQQQQNQQDEQEQTDLNFFQISQIKLIDYEPMMSQEKTKAELPLIKSNVEISLATNKLLLPQKYYNKLLDHIINAYFSDDEQDNDHEQSLSQAKNKKCSFSKKSQIKCNKTISLKKLQPALIQLTINGIQVQFPLKALFVSCKSSQCDLLIGISKHKKTVVIGQFIFDIFAVQYHVFSIPIKHTSISLYRLDNQWGQSYHSQKMYKRRKMGFISVIFFLIIKVIWWFIKVILYLAIFSLLLNCLYHWKDILGWFMDIKTKLQQKKNRKKIGNLFEEKSSFRDGARLISPHHALDDFDQQEDQQ